MNRNEARAVLQFLLKNANTTLANRWTLYLDNQILKLTPSQFIRPSDPIICTLTSIQVERGLSIGEWITITTAIELQYERLYPCQQPSKQ